MAMKAGKRAPYTERLVFDRMSATGDPDRPLMKMGMKDANPGSEE